MTISPSSKNNLHLKKLIEPQTSSDKKNEDSGSKGECDHKSGSKGERDHKSGSKDALDAKSEKESNLVGASFNLIKTIIGAGIISLPAAMKESGLLTGIILLGIMAVVTGTQCEVEMLRFMIVLGQSIDLDFKSDYR